jgi:type VI secretion system protein ImpA
LAEPASWKNLGLTRTGGTSAQIREVMDIQTLLQAISADAPCGQDLSFSTEFDQIAEMRREDDPTLEQGEWVTALKVADWPGVVRQCSTLLSKQTKDIRVAMWLGEAWAHTEGFAGLARGLDLCAQLSERFWGGLHPQPDGGDQEERIGNIAWFLQRAVSLVDTLPVARNRQGHHFCLRDWQHARHSALTPATPIYGQPEPVDTRPTMELLQRAARETPAATWQERMASVRAAEAALAHWQQVIDAQLGADGPGFVKARDTLASARHDIERLAREVGVSDGTQGMAVAVDGGDEGVAGSPVDDAALAPAGASAAAGQAVDAGPPRSRAQALQRLREVAEFFRRTEPHSPVAYLADKAVKWGDMPLHEWLRQVVKDQGSMAHLQELLGLDDPAADGS